MVIIGALRWLVKPLLWSMMIEEKDMDAFLFRAGALHNDFQGTSVCPWELQDIVSELCIQVGHLLQAAEQNVLMDEKGRKLSHFGDEAADVFLQILVLSHFFPLDWREIPQRARKMEQEAESRLLKSIVQGAFQLLESSLRINGKRFAQARHTEYDGEEKFFLKTLSDMGACLWALMERRKVDISSEFLAMERGARDFLSGYPEYVKKTHHLVLDMKALRHKIQNKIEQLHKGNEKKDGID